MSWIIFHASVETLWPTSFTTPCWSNSWNLRISCVAASHATLTAMSSTEATWAGLLGSFSCKEDLGGDVEFSIGGAWIKPHSTWEFVFFWIFARNLVIFLVQSEGSFRLHSPWDMWIIWRIHEACPIDASSIRIHKVILRKSLSGWFRDVTFWFLMLLKETDGRVWGLFDSSFSMLDSIPIMETFKRVPERLKFYDVAGCQVTDSVFWFIEWFSVTDNHQVTQSADPPGGFWRFEVGDVGIHSSSGHLTCGIQQKKAEEVRNSDTTTSPIFFGWFLWEILPLPLRITTPSELQFVSANLFFFGLAVCVTPKGKLKASTVW